MSDVRTERGDLVPERWEYLWGFGNEQVVSIPGFRLNSLITELASWQARAEQAESTIAAWKKDAEDKAVLIAELMRQLKQADTVAFDAAMGGKK